MYYFCTRYVGIEGPRQNLSYRRDDMDPIASSGGQDFAPKLQSQTFRHPKAHDNSEQNTWIASNQTVCLNFKMKIGHKKDQGYRSKAPGKGGQHQLGVQPRKSELLYAKLSSEHSAAGQQVAWFIF